MAKKAKIIVIALFGQRKKKIWVASICVLSAVR